MKDIDFDELDRAVSSVLGENVDEKQRAEEVPANSAPSNNSDTSSPTPATPTEAVEANSSDVPVAAPAKKTLVQKRSAGRFMDVVHPSSDMKNQQQKTSVSRHGVSLAPVSPPETETTQRDELVEDPVSQEQENPAIETHVVTEEPHAFPDPLDFHNFTPSSDDPKAMDTASNDAAEASQNDRDNSSPDEQPGDDKDDALDQTMSELAGLDGLMQDQREMPPLDTPFVSDLAVEKRPLGAFSLGNESDVSAKESADEEVVEKSDTPETHHDIGAAMNAALSDETDATAAKPDSPQLTETTDELAEEVVDENADAQTTPETEVIPEELQGDIVAIESREVTPTTGAAAAVAGSIPQQYVEKPAAQTEEETPVFDTTDYHQPLRHAAKKKSSWGTVLAILGLIILGAGAGAAIYYFDPFGLL